MSNLSRATYRVIHSLRRKASGEHDVTAKALVEAFGSEWNLNMLQMAKLELAVIEELRDQQRRIRAEG